MTDRPVTGEAMPAESSSPVPVVAVPRPPDTNPALVYLAGRASAVGRRGLQRSLDRAAEILYWRACHQHAGGQLGRGRLPARAGDARAAHRQRRQPPPPSTTSWPPCVVPCAKLGASASSTLRPSPAPSPWGTSPPPPCRPDATSPSGRSGDCSRPAATPPVGARAAAMLALLYGCGLRGSEAVAVALDDYREGAVTVVTGRRKERIVYCPAGGERGGRRLARPPPRLARHAACAGGQGRPYPAGAP